MPYKGGNDTKPCADGADAGADCQDWYAEATNIFVAGTETGDLIRAEVTTSDEYSTPGTPAPTPPAPPPTP